MLQLVDLKDTDFQNSKVASIGNVLVFHRKPHEMSVNRKSSKGKAHATMFTVRTML